jgi:ribosomal-protein-alanine N-acetyltransferase
MTTKRDHSFSDRKSVAVRIRSFKISDLRRIMEIERRAFPDAWDESWFVYFFQTNPNGFMVAVDDNDQTIGYAIVGLETEGEDAWLYTEESRIPPQRGHLLNIAVDEKCRGTGIGAMLLEAISQYVLERGVDELWLEVQTENTEAKRFYANKGFKNTGKHLRNYYPDGGDAIVMRKKLAK